MAKPSIRKIQEEVRKERKDYGDGTMTARDYKGQEKRDIKRRFEHRLKHDRED